MNLANIFGFNPLSGEEKKKLKEDEQRVEEATKGVLEAGQECLTSDSFRRYAEEYVKMEEELISIGVNTTITDPNHYNALCRMIFSNLKVCRQLIKSIRRDAFGG